MAYIEIPDDLLSPKELKDLDEAIGRAVGEKIKTGSMNLSRFMSIIKNACSYIWDKISGFISDIWGGLVDFFS